MRKRERAREKESTKDIECYNCGKKGHMAADCKNEKVVKCYNCGKAGHMSKECRQPKSASTSRSTSRSRMPKLYCETFLATGECNDPNCKKPHLGEPAVKELKKSFGDNMENFKMIESGKGPPKGKGKGKGKGKTKGKKKGKGGK